MSVSGPKVELVNRELVNREGRIELILENSTYQFR